MKRVGLAIVFLIVILRVPMVFAAVDIPQTVTFQVGNADVIRNGQAQPIDPNGNTVAPYLDAASDG